ncbi:hypothetical protein [Vibrio renipiscarius]|uniref:GTP-binding protein n=1 Tax=Vibrio renipiscarius TaxID=1461322 RepID=A0A0C2NEJ1_9VIBR|nr:hypothetical protein [Vibrio renipiscarius]KII76452.1 hypothetical protein OJ16_16825 [Vibrio renipiscarius]KII78026.1 hypothetical protein PL18_13745 [Vibrio renipiscarius]
MHRQWWLAIVVMLPVLVWAETGQEGGDEPAGQALVQINMSLELEGIERSIDATKQSLDSIGEALQRISHSDTLTDEQKEVLGHTLNNLDQLTLLSQQSMAKLPQAFNQTSDKLVTTSQHFLDDIQLKLLLIVGAIAVILLAALAGLYWFVVRPLQATLITASGNVSSMAKAIQITAQALENSTNKQQEIMQKLDKNAD